ncbi:RluA family pseudouridine synthase [bacterium]|nr:RluA family pseudouridine synthase [bacterium]
MRKHPVPGDRLLPLGLQMLYEDRDIFVVNKPAGLLTIATDKQRERTAYHVLTDYARKGNAKSPHRVFIVHRLDREASGILVFARTAKAKLRLQGEWDRTRKEYLAVVHGKLDKRADTITTYLAENRAHIVHSTTDPRRGKPSQTAYRVLRETKAYSLLAVGLLTGRKHQIRVHLAGIGHPIVGDRKYGAQQDTHKRLALHARSITFLHPFSGNPMMFEATTPGYFRTLVGEFEMAAPPPCAGP